MWTIIKKLNEQRAEKLASMKTLLDTADTAKRSLNAEESAKFDTLKAEAEEIKAQVDRHTALYQLTDEQRAAAAAQGQPEVPENDIRQYSLLRAISKRANGEALDGIEKEMNDELTRRNGRSAQGFWVPWAALSKRALDSSTGAGAKETPVLTGSFIELLRAKTLTNTLGARIMSGLVGELSIPAATGGATAQWVAEGSAPTGSNGTIGQVPLKPSTVSAFVDITRKFMRQTSLDAEAFVRDDLTQSIALAIDTAAFNGTGTNNQPKGILQNSDVTTVALGTNGAALDYASTVALETAVAVANADLGKLAYVSNAKVRGKLKTTLENSTSGAGYIWKSDNTVNGYGAFASNIIPGNLTKGTGTNLSAAIFGNFDDLIIGIWGGGLDLLVDPYTLSSSGGVRVVALQDADVQLRHAASFAKTVDIITA